MAARYRARARHDKAAMQEICNRQFSVGKVEESANKTRGYRESKHPRAN
jgi:hypothetical protein